MEKQIKKTEKEKSPETQKHIMQWGTVLGITLIGLFATLLIIGEPDNEINILDLLILKVVGFSLGWLTYKWCKLALAANLIPQCIREFEVIKNC